jgi:hypothetical protein
VDTEDDWTMTMALHTRHQGVETEVFTITTMTQTDEPQWLFHNAPTSPEDTTIVGSPARIHPGSDVPSIGGSPKVNQPSVGQSQEGTAAPNASTVQFGRRQSMAASKVETLVNEHEYQLVKAAVLDERDTVADEKLRERLRLLEQAKHDISYRREAAESIRSNSVSMPFMQSDSDVDEDEIEERRLVMQKQKELMRPAQPSTSEQPALGARKASTIAQSSPTRAPSLVRQPSHAPSTQTFAQTIPGTSGALADSTRKSASSMSQRKQSTVTMLDSSGSQGTNLLLSSGRSGGAGSFVSTPNKRGSIRQSISAEGQAGSSVRLPSITPEPTSRPLMSPQDRLETSLPVDEPTLADDGSPKRRQSMRRTSLEVANQSRSFRASKASQSFKITPRLQNTMEELMKKWQQ